MDLLQATDDKHLLLEDQFEGQANAARPSLHSGRFRDFWGKRYLCIHCIHDEEFWHFDIFDFLTNESKSVRFQKSSNQFRRVVTYFLNYRFMLVAESTRWNDFYRVNLVKLNWESGEFEALEHIERHVDFLRILADPLNQSKFVVLSSTRPFLVREYQKCKLVNDKIKFGNVHQRFSNRYFQYSSGKLIGIDYAGGQKFRVKTYNMANNQEQNFETEACPEHVQLTRNSPHKWVIDRVYTATRFKDSGNYGLMWADEKTRRWTILDFSVNMRIQRLGFFNGSLILYTKQAGTENGIFKSRVKFYEIAIGRPQSLRQKAWIRVIRNLEREGHSDLYKEARRYLPFNTDLRPHWFEDVEEESNDKQDSEKEEKSTGEEEVPSKRFKPN